MSEPLRWDSGIRFDSGLIWDGVVPETTHRKTMSNTKVIVDFTDYPAPDLAPVAQAAEHGVGGNGGEVPSFHSLHEPCAAVPTNFAFCLENSKKAPPRVS